MYTVLPACVPTPQKRAPDLIIDGSNPPCGCWELNSGSLEEQSVLLTAEPSLQPQDRANYLFFYGCLKRSRDGLILHNLSYFISFKCFLAK